MDNAKRLIEDSRDPREYDEKLKEDRSVYYYLRLGFSIENAIEYSSWSNQK